MVFLLVVGFRRKNLVGLQETQLRQLATECSSDDAPTGSPTVSHYRPKAGGKASGGFCPLLQCLKMQLINTRPTNSVDQFLDRRTNWKQELSIRPFSVRNL